MPFRGRLCRRPAGWAAALSTLAAASAAGLLALPATAQAATTTAAAPVGPRPSATRLGFTLGDQVKATVDVGTGNLEVLTTDLTLPGVGQDLKLGLDFNSLLLPLTSPLPSGSPGPGWAMRFGIDTQLIKNSDGSVLYLGTDGVEGLFTPGATAGTYLSPAGLKATLTTGTSAGSGGWTLTDHASAQKSTYDAAGELTSRTDRNANATTLVYGSYGHLSNIISTRGTATNNHAKVTTDANTGQLQGLTQFAQQSGGGNRSVSYGYTGGKLTSLTDTAGRVTTFGYDSTTGDLTSVTNPGGAVTQFAYTAHKIVKVTQPNPSAGSPGTSITRLAYPSGTSTQVADPDTVQSSAVSAVPHTTYTLDGTDRVLTAVDADGRTRSQGYTGNYDVNSTAIGTGSTASSSSASYGANSGESLTKATAPGGASGTLSYGNTGAGSKYSPSGGTDPQGNASSLGYDTAGNQTSGGNTALAATAKVTYNSDGTVATATDPANGTNSTVYNTDTTTHQLLSITPVAGGSLGVRSFTYDQYARLKTATDGAGHTTTYTYDDLDRTTSVAYSDGTPTVTNTYDSAGRAATRVDASGTTTYGYDALNHLTTRSSTAGGGTLTYGYDKAGNQTSLADGRGSTTYTYSPGGKLTSATTGAGSLIQFGYDDHGRRTDAWDATNTTNTSWALHSHSAYDTSGRVSQTYAEKTDGTRVADRSYCYANGNTNPGTCSTALADDRALLQSEKDNLTGAIRSYGYDAGNRLTSAATTGGPSPTSYAYTYSKNGDRLTTSTSSGSTGLGTTSHFNAANQITDTGYAYDGAGNATSSASVGTLTYNAAGQMTAAVNTSSGTGTYAYAGSNQNELVSQAVPGGAVIKYTYGRKDANGLPEIEQVGLNGTYAYIDHDPTTSQPLTLRLSNGNEAFYVFDGLNRPVALTTAAGTTSTYAYDPYGVTTSGGSGAAGGQNPYQFAPGSIYDRTTNMLKYGQRWYDPTDGRFTQQDSITRLANPRQGNKYAYAGDDPVNDTDPTGQFDFGDFFGVVLVDVGLTVSCAGAAAELGLDPAVDAACYFFATGSSAAIGVEISEG